MGCHIAIRVLQQGPLDGAPWPAAIFDRYSVTPGKFGIHDRITMTPSGENFLQQARLRANADNRLEVA